MKNGTTELVSNFSLISNNNTYKGDLTYNRLLVENSNPKNISQGDWKYEYTIPAAQTNLSSSDIKLNNGQQTKRWFYSSTKKYFKIKWKSEYVVLQELQNVVNDGNDTTYGDHVAKGSSEYKEFKYNLAKAYTPKVPLCQPRKRVLKLVTCLING